MLLDALEFIWLIVKTLHFWLIISAIVTATALREGLIEVTVGFGAVFIFLSYLYSKDSFLSIDIFARIVLAIIVGLFIAYFIWLAKN